MLHVYNYVITEPLVFVGTSDLTGLFRGKAVPLSRIEDGAFRGVGWVPTNALITCFDTIGDSPYGSLGDLLIKPATDDLTVVDFEDGLPPERFVVGNIQTLKGEPFAACTRAQLTSALKRLHDIAGLRLVSTFEHEFQFAANDTASMLTPAFSMTGHRAAVEFGETLAAALRKAGLKPESFINEFGEDQYELPVGIATGITVADQAVIFRELVRATAKRYQRQVSFNPLRSLDGVGNGVHVHFSLIDDQDVPVMHDPQGPHGLSTVAGAFVAGVLKYLPQFLCLTAPLATSYLRLTPHRWSAAYNNLGDQDREASLRICPVSATSAEQSARQFNIEYRAADAAASPYLVLAALVHAGSQGIREKLDTPQATTEDISLLNAQALTDRGLTRLPESLEDALSLFKDSECTSQWFGAEFKSVYLALKRAELEHLSGMTPEEQCALYGRVY